MAKITIEKLAEMINNGFEKTATKEQFEKLDKRLGVVEKDVKEIKLKLNEVDKLETKVDYIENVLAIKK